MSNIEIKKNIVSNFQEKINDGVVTIVVAHYRGMTVQELFEARKIARDNDVNMFVMKNTLARRALDGTSFSELQEILSGPTIMFISNSAINSAYVTKKVCKISKKFEVIGGVIENKMFTKEDLSSIAKYENTDNLRSSFLSLLQYPMSYFGATLNAYVESQQNK